MPVTISGTDGIVGNLTGNVIGNFTGSVSATNVNTNVLSAGRIVFSRDRSSQTKAPYVLAARDTRDGCPPNWEADRAIQQITFTLTASAVCTVNVQTITLHPGRTDTVLYINNNVVQRHLTGSANISWQPVNLAWAGVLAPGPYNIQYRSTTANSTGCFGEWSGMHVILTEL